VAPRGLTRLWAGGVGTLAVTGQGEAGRPLDWRFRLIRDAGGVVLEESRLPITRQLPAGGYVLKALTRPLAWAVELAAGARAELVVGPKGILAVSLDGPQGPLRAAYRLTELAAGRPAGVGYTNRPLKLKPGRYLLRLEVPPGLSREVTVPPAGRAELNLPATGGLVVTRAPGRGGVDILTPQGEPVAQAPSGRVTPLLSGRYLVSFGGDPPRVVRVEVQPGGLLTVRHPAGDATR